MINVFCNFTKEYFESTFYTNLATVCINHFVVFYKFTRGNGK